MNDFLKKVAGMNEYGSIVADGVEAGDVEGFIDTGSYIFNALLSGSIYGGLPSNKITSGAANATWRARNGTIMAISSGRGSRFCGGRQGRTLTI